MPGVEENSLILLVSKGDFDDNEKLTHRSLRYLPRS
jgi:hypothetical protein